MRWVEFNTLIGRMGAAETGGALINAWVVGQKYAPDCTLWQKDASSSIFRRLQEQLHEYFCGTRRCFELPLDARGTIFQKRVWDALQQIPYGEVVTYGTVAQRMNCDSAVRAVGAAVGRNPLLILVPCHRVIGKNGDLTGFAAGVERKEQLLLLESGKKGIQKRWELEPENAI